MIPILYRGNEKQFQTNGLGRLADCVSCTATEERNGIYEVTFTVPVTSTMYPLIEIGCIVCVIHDDKKDLQPFDIYAKSAELDGLVTFYARHISYRLRNIILKPFTAQSCAAALDQMATQTYNPNPFTFWTDKAVSASWANRVPNSCRAMLMGHQGSILDVYGKGEYEFDKWTVRLYTNRGNDNGMSIRYGVNLTEMDQEFSLSDSYSAVAPYWQSPEGDVVVMLPEGYIVSGEVPIKRSPWTTASGEVITTASGEPIEFNVPQIVPVPMDLSADFEEQPTEDQLRDRARQLLENSEAWLPDENITISFVDLAHTADYAEVSALQRVSLCDRINVYCGPLGITAKAQVVRVVYNVIEECYDETELGKPRATYADTIMAEVSGAISTADKAARGFTAQAVESATAQITGATDSHVRFMYGADGSLQEILIMDTESVTTAVKVWRWNSGGLGFSSNGYGGPYTTAITQDGQIVADFITAGQMMANIIKGGTLTLGGLNDANGLLQVLDAAGNVIGTWNNAGLTMDKGRISLKINAGAGYVTIGSGKNAIYYYYKDSNDYEYRQQMYNDTLYLGNTTMSNYTYFRNNDINMWRNTDTTDAVIGTDIAINMNNEISGKRLWIQSKYGIQLKEKSGSAWLSKTTLGYTGIYTSGNVTVGGNLSVAGTKPRLVTTDQYSKRYLYCYETPTPMFGDIGEGVIGADGRCFIALDAVFAQTVTTQQYQVFLQRYGEGDCFVAERRGGYFVVQGTPGLAFGWEVKAKQKDFDQLRLERADEPFTVPEQRYGAEAAQYITELKNRRVSA